jgi:adenylate kinase family enzyme
MKKIIVIGSSGAGKSTFARRLGEATGLEVIHLDRLYWKPNWTETPKDEWRKTVERIVRGDSWIIDGNFGGTLEPRFEACDTVIFLEMPPAVCVYRILKRVVFYRPGRRPDMADGCHEKFDWEFLKWVWNFPKRSQPKIEAQIDRFQDTKTIIRLRSKGEVENFLANITVDEVKTF